MNDLLQTFGPAKTLGGMQVIFACLVAFVLSSLLTMVYRKTFQGLSYSRSFVHALILASLSSCVVIMAIGNNLARGLGILGTLALVRFRTPIRDPRDILFLFMSFGIGIATGAAVFQVAAVGTVCFCLVALYLHFSPFASRREFEGLLRFMTPPQIPDEEGIRALMRKCCESYQLVAMREAAQGELLEYAYQVRLLDPSYQGDLLEGLRKIQGITNPSLLMQRSTVEL